VRWSEAARIGPYWTWVELGGHSYLGMRVVGEQLAPANPISLMAAGIPGAQSQVSDYTVRVAGAAFPEGAGLCCSWRAVCPAPSCYAMQVARWRDNKPSPAVVTSGSPPARLQRTKRRHPLQTALRWANQAMTISGMATMLPPAKMLEYARPAASCNGPVPKAATP
jgi:hypothetical protein